MEPGRKAALLASSWWRHSTLLLPRDQAQSAQCSDRRVMSLSVNLDHVPIIISSNLAV